MKLLNYIRGLRNGKEAHRLEKESMQDPFLADALDGYSQLAGDHERRIKELQAKIRERSFDKKGSNKKKNIYAISWSIAACLIIGVGISSYFLFLKGDVAPQELLIVQETKTMPVSKDSGTQKEDSKLSGYKIKADSNQLAQNRASVKIQAATPQIKVQEEIDEITTTDEMMEAKPEDDDPTVSNAEPDKIQARVALQALDGRHKDIAEQQIAEHQSIAKPKVRKMADEVQSEKVEKTMVPVSEPVIGMSEYRAYLKKNRTRPQSNDCDTIKGKVLLTFSVDQEGRPYHIKVKKSLCNALDAEAIRLVKEGPAWTYTNAAAEISIEFD